LRDNGYFSPSVPTLDIQLHDFSLKFYLCLNQWSGKGQYNPL